MKIINIAVEIAPIAKVGGLGDVLYGLNHQLVREGIDVEVIVPKHKILDVSLLENLKVEREAFEVKFDGQAFYNTIWTGTLSGIPLTMIDSETFFHRSSIYGCEDDVDRFLYFSKAALELIRLRGQDPDILHLHDWHTAACAPLYKGRAKKIFTIHNLAYQGKILNLDLKKIGLDAEIDDLKDDNDPTHVNLMKGGIVYSDAFTTVSKTYAKEIQTKRYGQGLEKLIHTYKEKLYGIVNGLDYSYWDPKTDPYLKANFSSDGLDHQKERGKNLFREELVLEEADRPMIGCVSRLVPQKGVNLIRYGIEIALKNNAQFVLLGTSPIPEIDREFHEIMNAYAKHPDVRLILKHEEETAHRIFASSDIFIVPSEFEPCGLTQLIAMRYGSIPVVRKTGGLADTIVDFDSGKKKANGYMFDNSTLESFEIALKRAINDWFKDPGVWRQRVLQVMDQDFSWKKPANLYLELFQKISS